VPLHPVATRASSTPDNSRRDWHITSRSRHANITTRAVDESLKTIEETLKRNGIEIKDVTRLLRERDSFRPLTGQKQVYDEAVRLISLAERAIRASAFGEGPSSAPPRLGDAYADKLRKSMDSGRPVRLDIVIGADSEYRVSAARKQRLEQRYKLYEEQGVIGSVHFCLVTANVGLDYLIVDNSHMIVAVPYRSGVEGFKYGLLFHNAPEIVNEFVDWFDHVLCERAKVVKSLEKVTVFDRDQYAAASET
jgi:hypothetical protein